METTKGNWEIRPTGALNENGKPLFYDIVTDGYSFISTHKCHPLGISDDEQLANAKLISCAPEMLELLSKVDILQSENYGNGMSTHLALIDLAKEIRGLIKKATE